MEGNTPILGAQAKGRRDAKPDAVPANMDEIGKLAVIAGVFIVLLGWIDIGVAWASWGIGSPEWEFGTVSATVDGLPLSTMGLIIVFLASMWSGMRGGLFFTGIWAGWVLLVLLVAGILYGLTVPVAFNAVGPEARTQLVRAVTKTSTMLVFYLAFYGWVGLHVIRRIKKERERLKV